MRICAVEIKSNEAIICLLEKSDGLFQIPDCRVQRFVLRDSNDNEQLRKLRFDIAKLVEDYRIETVVIKERPTKGKFAGSAVGFKIEAAIQLIDNLDVKLIRGNRVNEIIKENPILIDFRETGLKKFQEGAFTTAYAYMNS